MVFSLAVALSACAPRSIPEVAADPAFCDTLHALVTASDGDFASLRQGERSALMPSWQSSVTFRGAESCRVAGDDPVSYGAVFCVLATSREGKTLRRAWEAATARVRTCLPGWNGGAGEQLGTRWVDFTPDDQMPERRLLVTVRVVDPPDRDKGSVSLDVTVRKSGAGIVTPTPTPP